MQELAFPFPAVSNIGGDRRREIVTRLDIQIGRSDDESQICPFRADDFSAQTVLDEEFNYIANNVVLNLLAFIVTDVESDGHIDGANFLSFQRTNPSLIPQWDLDYPVVPLAGSQAVPEPDAVLLLIVGAVLFLGLLERRPIQQSVGFR